VSIRRTTSSELVRCKLKENTEQRQQTSYKSATFRKAPASGTRKISTIRNVERQNMLQKENLDLDNPGASRDTEANKRERTNREPIPSQTVAGDNFGVQSPKSVVVEKSEGLPPISPIFQNVYESTWHLFFTCTKAQIRWNYVFALLAATPLSFGSILSPANLLAYAIKRQHRHPTQLMLVSEILWCIWFERNQLFIKISPQQCQHQYCYTPPFRNFRLSLTVPALL
jgi:hypothetical protein